MTKLGSPPPSERPKPIYARSGWEIPQPSVQELAEYSQKIHPTLVRTRTEQLVVERRKRNHSDIQIRSMPDFLYNCVGMIFASRRAFIEIQHIYAILREDGYREISREDVTIGDIVLYYDNKGPSHVGLVILVDPLGIRVLSKWGIDGELEHLEENVPPGLGRPVEYYTERIL